MTYNNLIDQLLRSSREGWLQDDSRGISTLMADLNVTVRLRQDENPEKFTTEDWATKHPDPNASIQVFELWYGASFVKEYYFCSVDGHRARLPYPKVGTLEISQEQYAIASAVDLQGSLDEYMNRSGLKLE